MKSLQSRMTLLVLGIALWSNSSLMAQSRKKDNGFAVATEFHITPPLSQIALEHPVPDDFGDQPRRESEDREHRTPQKFKFSPEDGAEYANDPKTIQTEPGQINASQMKASWGGQSASGFRPLDPTGAAGPNHYVQMINSTTMKVYNKSTGSAVNTVTLGNLWATATPNDGDPIVMYDKPADRWFLSQFGQSGNKIYIAVSTTGDPTGSYYTYSFTSPEFPDYLKFSVWQDGYYMTSNLGTQRCFAFERSAMIAGTPGARMVYTTFSPPDGGGFFCPLTGCAADGTLPPAGTPCPIFSYSDNGWGTGFVDRVNIYKMAVNWTTTTPSATITAANNVPTAAFDASYNSSWNDCPQPGTTQKLDGIGGVCMFRAQYKIWQGYNSVVLNWGVKISSTQRSIKWVELRQDATTGVWSLYQEGIYTPDTDTRWMGAILMDNNGSIGLSYMKSNSTSTYPGLYYTGRRSCDPLGTLPITEVQVIAGTTSQTGDNRDGDYAHATLDPDGVTIWATSEYMGGSSGSNAARTRIFSYQIAPCNLTAAVSIAVTSGSNPSCPGVPITFTATPTNGGSAPTYAWYVNGTANGSSGTTFTSSTLAQGDVVTCVMTSNLADVVGSPATSNAITISLSSNVTPSVSVAQTAGNNPLCAGATATFTATPSNGGATPSYQWLVNGANAGSNSATFSSTTLTNGQTVQCVLTSSVSCATTNTATSNTITVSVTSSVVPAVSIAITTGTNPANAGDAITFTATPTNGGASPTYAWQVNGTAAGMNSATFTTSTLADGAVVTCTITSNATCAVPATATSSSITMTINGGSTYCDAQGVDATYEYISQVAIGAINNASDASNYTDFTAQQTTVQQGSSASITVTIGNGYSTDKIYIWCDWNQNGVFTDTGEQEYASATGTGPFTTNITVPATASTGAVRMRIRLTDTANGPNATPCGDSDYGEVEDYTLVVETGIGVTELPSNPASGVSAEDLKVYPNPNHGDCTVEGAHAGVYYLVNEAGQLVRTIVLNSDNKYTCQLEHLAAGMYVISGQNKYGVVKRKILVQ